MTTADTAILALGLFALCLLALAYILASASRCRTTVTFHGAEYLVLWRPPTRWNGRRYKESHQVYTLSVLYGGATIIRAIAVPKGYVFMDTRWTEKMHEELARSHTAGPELLALTFLIASQVNLTD